MRCRISGLSHYQSRGIAKSLEEKKYQHHHAGQYKQAIK
jgi:hypothetical protein